jgi:5-methylcytosine-specific restriction endonuclease McrA
VRSVNWFPARGEAIADSTLDHGIRGEVLRWKPSTHETAPKSTSTPRKRNNMPRPEYQTPEWKRRRKVVLARDGHRCQLRLPKCKGRATEVDHIVNIDDGGSVLAFSNLQAACKSCNSAKRNSEVAARARAYRDQRLHPIRDGDSPAGASARAKLTANPDMGYDELSPAERKAITGYDW